MGETFILTRDTEEASEKRAQWSRASEEGLGLPFTAERASADRGKGGEGTRGGRVQYKVRDVHSIFRREFCVHFTAEIDFFLQKHLLATDPN